MSEQTAVSSAKTRRRRWWQFSLRGLLLLLVPLACFFAWLGAEYRRCGRQREAIAWVEEKGGTVEYDEAATQRDWRRRVFGSRFPGVVRGVDMNPGRPLGPMGLSDPGWEDALFYSYEKQLEDIRPLAALVDLESLSFFMCQEVSDVSPLAGLRNLKVLDLSCTGVRDVSPLAGLRELERLDMTNTGVSDEDLAALREALPECEIVKGF